MTTRTTPESVVTPTTCPPWCTYQHPDDDSTHRGEGVEVSPGGELPQEPTLGEVYPEQPDGGSGYVALWLATPQPSRTRGWPAGERRMMPQQARELADALTQAADQLEAPGVALVRDDRELGGTSYCVLDVPQYDELTPTDLLELQAHLEETAGQRVREILRQRELGRLVTEVATLSPEHQQLVKAYARELAAGSPN